jgi:hypothetical protein
MAMHKPSLEDQLEAVRLESARRQVEARLAIAKEHWALLERLSREIKQERSL